MHGLPVRTSSRRWCESPGRAGVRNGACADGRRAAQSRREAAPRGELIPSVGFRDGQQLLPRLSATAIGAGWRRSATAIGAGWRRSATAIGAGCRLPAIGNGDRCRLPAAGSRLAAAGGWRLPAGGSPLAAIGAGDRRSVPAIGAGDR
jgi:hypothetical protein